MTNAELELVAQTEIYAERVFAAEITAGEGRTVDVRVVPYGQRAKANDGLGGLPRGVMYDEEILAGAFDHQLNAANRVHVNVEHEQGISGKVGHGLALRSGPDGLYGSFRLHDTPNGNTALELVRGNALGGVSFEAKFVKSLRTAEGVVQRVRCNLRNIALCREPAYEGAVVLGLREEIDDELILEEQLLPIPFDPELAERIEALGLEVPDRLKAHPSMTHPAQDVAPVAGAPVSE